MFSITNTRIVGLIAVVCAAIAAPQALATANTHSRLAPPADGIQGNDLGFDLGQGNELGGFDLGDLKNGRVAFTAATHKSGTAAIFVYVPSNPGWGGAATEAKKSAAKPAAKTAPVVCNGQPEYEYVYSGCQR